MGDPILHELSSGKNYHLTLPCVIGRGKEADLAFPDRSISHRHALITETDDERICIQDLESANGVFVNDLKIRDKTTLKPGDSIQLGRTKFLVSRAENDITERTVVLHSLGPEVEWNLDRQRLKAIYEITTELTENQDVTRLGEKIFSKFKEIFKQDRAYIASFQEDGTLKPLCLSSVDESAPLSKSIINRLLRSGESFLLEDALSDASFREQESIMALRVRSALCAPLIFRNQIYGLIYLDRNIPGAYKQEDLEFLRSIGSILAPLIENARLWSELKDRYAGAIKTLKKTQARLIGTERTAAYVRLAHAMAHEIRNPLTVIGGLVKKMSRAKPEISGSDTFKAIANSVERVELVLKEVDSYVKISPPQKTLHRIDQIIREEIERNNEEWQKNSLYPSLSVTTSYIMIPVDAGLFKKAISMVFREIVFSRPCGSDVKIAVRDNGNELEIVFGEIDAENRLCEPFDPEIRGKPWSLGLFLNIAHKILSDQGGRILLDPLAHSAFPIVMRLPRTKAI
ncbi:MAG: FHA domain-containing protein [Thermodesulfovibrionia bacterium]|nr:FHA domain-containing protein [Thermodesulfovibrionia bacterium]